jgi:serine/threonine-protein kinase
MRNSSPVALGQVIANKYQVEGVLGEGGMGVVVSAWHLGLEQRVAIKLLLSHMRDAEGSALERFQREARAAARIRSEYVCRVLDTGSLEDGTPFLVMEYLEGADLADELLRRGRFEVAEAVRYVREACLALIEAHQAGVIHRDLKPANLFLVQRPDGARSIKVVDFGVSKSISRSGTPHLTLTKTSAMVGSPIYMSPEQLSSSKDVDGRTDIWALGTILYELITGRTPFYGESIPQLVNAVLNTEPDGFAALGITAPAGLEQVVRRALSKQRDGRFANARELFTALGPYVSDAPGSISGTVATQKTPLPTRSMNIDNSASPASAPVISVPDASGSKRTRFALLAVLLIAVAGIAALLSRRSPPASEARVPSSPAAPAREAGMAPAPVGESTRAAQVGPTAPASEGVLSGQPAAHSAEADAQMPRGMAMPSELEQKTREPRRPRVTPRTEPAQPQPSPVPSPKPETDDDALPRFGGRR